MLSALATFTLPILFSTFVLWFTMHHPRPPLPTSFSDPSTPLTLLIAHPDDESMFFAPTLLALTSTRRERLQQLRKEKAGTSKPKTSEQNESTDKDEDEQEDGGYSEVTENPNIRIYCLSNGNASGLGPTRSLELKKAAGWLGISSSSVTVLSMEEGGLIDEMGRSWSEDEVGSLLGRLEEEKGRTGVWITFDEGGVSGHENHRSVYRGLIAYLRSQSSTTSLSVTTPAQVWVLPTVSLLRKYSGWIEAVWDLWMGSVAQEVEGRVKFVSGWEGYLKAREAMVRGHVSQMVWFRWGWISVGRYMYVNEIVRVLGGGGGGTEGKE